jgi:transposase
VELGGDGGRVVHVSTAHAPSTACPVCGEFSTSPKQWRTTRPKDLPFGPAPVAVRWRKRQWRCRAGHCPRKVFTESIPELPPGARVTGRLRRHAGRCVGAGRSVTEVALGLPVSWPVVHAGFVAHADGLLAEPEPATVLGIDETRRGRPRWERTEEGTWRLGERFETNFVDLAGDGGLLGQSAGRTSKTVTDWLAARGPAFAAAVQVVAIDPCAAYRHAVQTALPNARIVADHFHVVRLGNAMVTDVRQRVTRETLGRRGRKADHVWPNRRLLLRGFDRLSPRARDRLWASLEAGDPTGEIAAAWIGKEHLRELLAARDRHTISERLVSFYDWAATMNVPELTRLAETIDAWWPEILGFLETRITNAGTEAVNRLIKDAARIAFGFRNLDNQRRRVRFHCTRRQRTASARAGAMPPQL